MSNLERETIATQISIPYIFSQVKREKPVFFTILVTATTISVLIALLLPPIYTAKASLLPPNTQQSGGAGSAIAALGALSGGTLSALTGQSQVELYASLLRSDGILRSLDEKFNLRERYGKETFEELRAKAAENLRITTERKSGVIVVEVDDESPKIAADIANSLPDELEKILGRISITDSQKRLRFFEQELKKTKAQLTEAEISLQALSKKTGIIAIDAQTQGLIQSVAILKSRILSSEVSLKVLLETTTREHPDAIRLRNEIAALRHELQKIESAKAGDLSTLPGGNLQESTTDFIRAVRELKFQEAMLEGMTKQYELARLDASGEGPALQIVDVAHPPERKSKPSRALIVLIGSLTGAIAAVIWIIAKVRYRNQ